MLEGGQLVHVVDNPETVGGIDQQPGRVLDLAPCANQSPEFVEALTQCRPDQIVIDLVRLPIYGSLLKAEYRGICW